MLNKILTGILVSLHLLNPSTKVGPVSATPPPAIQIPSDNGAPDLSISDEVYADLAMQHELDHVSVYYFDDNPKNTISINAEKGYDPASTIKLFVAMYAFDQVVAGKISLDQMVTIQDKNVVPSQSFPNGYGPLASGDNVSVYELLDRMITQSGNTSYNTLVDLLDRANITKYIHDLGLVNSGVGAKLNLDDGQEKIDQAAAGFGANTTNADDYARAFILINGKRIPGSVSLFDMLSRQKFNSMIPALLPKDVVVAHKTGELDPFYHDGGIVVGGNRRYILSVFSDMGTPSVVAHVSDLVYTANPNLVGSNRDINKTTSEVPDVPIDPLVADGENQAVLAANTGDVAVPKITNADLGIRGSDLSSGFSLNDLPAVIIPRTSPFHFLITVAERVRLLNPVPSIRAQLMVDNSKQDLAEANDLISKGRKSEAGAVLQKVGSDLEGIAKGGAAASSLQIQSQINKVSETRFSLMSKELAGASNDTARAIVIKEIADTARATTKNIKPYVKEALKANDLSQTPVLGRVTNVTASSITIKTPDGKSVTTNVDSHINVRDPGQGAPQVINTSDIKVGTTIAISGTGAENQIKPSFVLTNISDSRSNQAPAVILKVNPDKNTFVIVNKDGAVQQVDLTKQSVIKGPDTAVSLSELKSGDTVVVHGDPLPSTPSSTLTPSATPSGTATLPGTSLSLQPGPTTVASIIPSASIPPIATKMPSVVSSPKASGVANPTSMPSTQKVTPKVIKGDVIQVIQTPTKPTGKTAKPKDEKVEAKPSPAATPETERKH